MEEKSVSENVLGLIILFSIITGVIYFFAKQGEATEKTEPILNKSNCYVIPTPKPWNCGSDCSGHKAGYNWAKQKGARTPLDCTGNSNSFIEGCEYYVQELEHQATLESCIDSYEKAQYE